MSANPENMVGDRPSLVKKFASKYDIDPKVLMVTLKATCFRVDDGQVSDEQMVALLVVADQYNLNPFTREIFAFPDKHKGIVPVVSIDGWVRIINEHPDYNGYDVILPEGMLEPTNDRPACYPWVSIRMHRKNVEFSPTLTEHLDECYKPPIKKTGNNGPYQINGPWQTHPKRLLRHKALIQAARIVFGFSGIYDEDEAARILESSNVVAVQPQGATRTEQATDRLKKQLTDQAGTGGLELPLNHAAAAAAVNQTVSKTFQERAATPINQPVHKYEIASALAFLRSRITLAALEAAWKDVSDDYDFSGREMPVDVEAIYRDLKEALEQKEQQ